MKQKIYISGQISGISYKRAKAAFSTAEAMLEELGYEVLNPLNNGLDQLAPWEAHMIVDIEMLMKADKVYMLSNWHESKGARIEHYIACETGKVIYYGQI